MEFIFLPYICKFTEYQILGTNFRQSLISLFAYLRQISKIYFKNTSY